MVLGHTRFVVTLAAVAFATSSAAQDICVECSGPDMTYRCTVKDAGRVQHIRGSGKAIEFVCITELARAGSHKSCKVGTGYSGPCIGHPREIDVSKAGEPVILGAQPPETGATLDGPARAAAEVQKKADQPETLEQLARETVTKSKEQWSQADNNMKKAGDAVGGAIKKSWHCLATLFTKC